MSFARRRLSRSIVLALLIAVALAAGHQHQLLAPPAGETHLSQPESTSSATPRLSDCAVCRALQSTEPGLGPASDRLIIHIEHAGEVGDNRPTTLPRTRRSPRAPPALRS